MSTESFSCDKCRLSYDVWFADHLELSCPRCQSKHYCTVCGTKMDLRSSNNGLSRICLDCCRKVKAAMKSRKKGESHG